MQRQRHPIMLLIFLFIYSGLMAKIAYYQIIEGQDIAREASNMRNREIELQEYARGEILDRNLLPLTDTQTSTALYCVPREIGREDVESVSGHVYQAEISGPSRQEVAEKLEGALGRPDAHEITLRLRQAQRTGAPFVRIASDLTDKQVQSVTALNLPGAIIAPMSKRYRQDGFLSHVLGYVGGKENGAGQAGLEKIYDQLLRESPSSPELISVFDARGMAIQGLMFKVRKDQDEHKGSVVLTIDKRVQEIAEKAMSKRVKSGAVVVMDVHSKEILAMASRPAYSPYDLEYLIKHDRESSLTNRALSRFYPGSLFKIVVTAAALEEKVVTTDRQFNCTGKYVFNPQLSISCWKEEGHGPLDFSQAFALSCNPSFIEVVLDLGRQNLLRYVEKMHVTDETLRGYDLYSPGSYVKINPGGPALGNACLGQEGVMLTPLQLTSLIATIADDGLWNTPSLVRYTTDRTGNKTVLPQSPPEQVISKQTALTIQQLMAQVVSEGTGKSAALGEVKVAGKTATSQTGSLKKDGEEVLNTWFGGFFPADHPRWAIVVLAEEGTSGAENAAPVFKEIAREMLKCYSIDFEEQ